MPIVNKYQINQQLWDQAVVSTDRLNNVVAVAVAVVDADVDVVDVLSLLLLLLLLLVCLLFEP